jgi:hypothetical protein
LRSQVKIKHFGSSRFGEYLSSETETNAIIWDQLSRLLSEDGDRVVSETSFKIHIRMMDNAQKIDHYNNTLSSDTYF